MTMALNLQSVQYSTAWWRYYDTVIATCGIKRKYFINV